MPKNEKIEIDKKEAKSENSKNKAVKKKENSTETSKKTKNVLKDETNKQPSKTVKSKAAPAKTKKSEIAEKTILEKEEKAAPTETTKNNTKKTREKKLEMKEEPKQLENETLIESNVSSTKKISEELEQKKDSKSSKEAVSNNSKIETIEEKDYAVPINSSGKGEFKTIEVVVLVLITCVISLAAGSVLGIRFSENIPIWSDISDNETIVTDVELQKFLDDYYYLIENYYGEIDKKELLNTAFKSMVDSLDDAYSGTIGEGVSNNFDIELNGSYEGLGVEIVNDENLDIYIYGIIPNSPASRSTLQVGDKIVKVNGVTVNGMTTTVFIDTFVKNSDTTNFEIVVERNGVEQIIDIKKGNIILDSVISKIYEMNDKKIGYLQVTIFAANTYEQFKRELENLEKAGIDSLMIDLRNNSGGHLTAVRDMISLFLDSSHVIYQTQDNDKKVTKVYSKGKKTKKYPIVLLGNSSSASASEVMIGALVEEYDAILIGNQSFGKGTVQELHVLSTGEEYKFTTKKWLTPSGNWIHGVGIKPTIEVILSKEYYENPSEENDNQLKAAIDYLSALK